MSEPKKNTAFTFAIGLGSRLARPAFQAAPTLAAGDFKVSIDGGAFTNLATLPTVTPAGGTRVQIAMSAAEMNGDNIMVQCIDAAGGEWDDVIITFDLSVRNADDLATPTNITAGTITTVTGAVGSVSAGVAVATNNDKTGYDLSATAVQAIWDALTSALTAAGSIGKKLADWTIGTAQTGDSFARLGAPAGASVSADVAAVKADTGTILTAVDTEVAAILAAVDTEVAAIKAKTDLIPASFPANFSATVISATGDVSADVNKINGVTIIGDGSATPFGV